MESMLMLLKFCSRAMTSQIISCKLHLAKAAKQTLLQIC